MMTTESWVSGTKGTHLVDVVDVLGTTERVTKFPPVVVVHVPRVELVEHDRGVLVAHPDELLEVLARDALASGVTRWG